MGLALLRVRSARLGSLVMRSAISTFLATIASFVVLSATAHADPGVTSEGGGTAAAIVADPITLQRLADLRFGRFASPTTPGTIQINPDGSFSAAGDVASSTGMAQPASGRGPAQFRVEQAGNRGGTVYIPQDITLASGPAAMDVTNITARLVVISGFGRTRVYRLDLGGTLQVKANQAPGRYRGEFDITIIYN